MAKILVVDDEEKIRTMIKKFAGVEGHEVVRPGRHGGGGEV